MFFCKLGKDRTGLLAALVLAACGATDDQIVADYTRWVGVWTGRNGLAASSAAVVLLLRLLPRLQQR